MVYAALTFFSLINYRLFPGKKMYFFITYSMIALVAGLRDASVGTDTFSYYRDFYRLQNLDFTQIDSGFKLVEPGYLMIIKLSSIFPDGAPVHIFLYSVLTFLALGIFIYHNTNNKNYWLATFLVLAFGFMFYSMNAMRQSLAIAIACNSLTYLMKREYLKAGFIILISMCFHLSLVVMAPVILLAMFYLSFLRKFPSFNNFLGYLVFMMAVSVVIASLGWYVLNNIDLLNNLFLKYYLSSKYGLEAQTGLYMITTVSIYSLFLVLSFVYTRYKEESVIVQTACLRVYLSLAIAATLCSAYFMIIFYRVVDTFSIYLVILAPLVMWSVRNKYVRIIGLVGIVLFGCCYEAQFLWSGFNEVTNYRTLF